MSKDECSSKMKMLEREIEKERKREREREHELQTDFLKGKIVQYSQDSKLPSQLHAFVPKEEKCIMTKNECCSKMKTVIDRKSICYRLIF
jgi:hypothetical protein